jgi:isopentenyl-diphosphate delta-isomerase
MASQVDPESTGQFESRKKDHIRLALRAKNQASGESGLDRVAFIHEALPELNFSEISIAHKSFGRKVSTPFLISSMTGGHEQSGPLNLLLARAAQARGWRMGVGSQRRELGDTNAAREWSAIRKEVPGVRLLGNLGLAQLIQTPLSEVERLVDSLEAEAMIIHLNVLQECLQPEGTPNFKGGVKALERLAKRLEVPVVVKETGCGFSKSTLKRLKGLGLGAVDVSGLGGTHWGRIEGDRHTSGDLRTEVAENLAHWGVSTVDSLVDAVKVKPDYEIWASGGVRSGLDAAKLMALGANTVGFAAPLLEAALRGEDELIRKMSVFEYELKTILFCTGCRNLGDLQRKKVLQWRTK